MVAEVRDVAKISCLLVVRVERGMQLEICDSGYITIYLASFKANDYTDLDGYPEPGVSANCDHTAHGCADALANGYFYARAPTHTDSR